MLRGQFATNFGTFLPSTGSLAVVLSLLVFGLISRSATVVLSTTLSTLVPPEGLCWFAHSLLRISFDRALRTPSYSVRNAEYSLPIPTVHDGLDEPGWTRGERGENK